MAADEQKLKEIIKKIQSYCEVKRYSFTESYENYKGVAPNARRVSDGICFGLAVTWVKLHMTQKGECPPDKSSGQWRHLCMELRNNELTVGEDFKEADIEKSQFAQAHKIHEKYKGDGFEADGKPFSHDDGMSNVAKFVKINFQIRDKKYYKAGEKIDPLAELVNKTHKYHLTKITFVNGGAHAMCCYKSSGKIFGLLSHLYFFDQNIGEIKVDSGKVSEFYQDLFDLYSAMGSDIASYETWEITQSAG